MVRGHAQAFGLAVDRNDTARSKHPCALDRKLPDRAAAPDRHGVARLDIAVLRRHVAGGEDVGDEQRLLVADLRRDLDRPHIGKRHPHVLRLPPRVSPHHVRVAEQARGRVPVQLLSHPGVRVGVVAEGPQLAVAEEAPAARDGERNHHPVANAEGGVLGTDLHHLAHELMPQDVPAPHGGDESVEEVKVGPADRCQRDLDDGITRIQDLRVRHVRDADVVRAVPAEGFHPRGCPSVEGTSPLSRSCLNRRRSSRISVPASRPTSRASAAPAFPPGGLY